MANSEQYDVNFFRPLSNHAKANKKLILTLAIVWAVAVFGFQFLLMIFNEPTPEKSYEVYQSVYPAVVEDISASAEMKADFGKSLLHVLGKNVAVSEEHKIIVKKAFTWNVANMLPDSLNTIFFVEPDENSFAVAAQTLKLQNSGFDKIMIDLIPTSLVKLNQKSFPAECKSELPAIMDLYLIHNQSFLTDFNFFGFPFHYWYTAQFLLILFVVLCVIYAVTIDKANKTHDFVEET